MLCPGCTEMLTADWQHWCRNCHSRLPWELKVALQHRENPTVHAKAVTRAMAYLQNKNVQVATPARTIVVALAVVGLVGVGVLMKFSLIEPMVSTILVGVLASLATGGVAALPSKWKS